MKHRTQFYIIFIVIIIIKKKLFVVKLTHEESFIYIKIYLKKF